MIRVYFENQSPKYAELVAIFENEELYKACIPTLEAEAIKVNMILTESVEGAEIYDKDGNIVIEEREI